MSHILSLVFETIGILISFYMTHFYKQNIIRNLSHQEEQCIEMQNDK